MQNQTKTKRIFYFDALRMLAIISVILFHIFGSTNQMTVGGYGAPPSLSWFINDVNVVCFRFGVDLFLMLSGALSLGRNWDIKSFLGKRFPRIIGPFVFWGFILSLVSVLISYFYPNVLKTIDPYTIYNFLIYLVNSYLVNNENFGLYWFFWMILGTYLIMPILNKWLLNSELKEAEYFLAIWAITCIFDFTFFINIPVNLNYFTGPIGMVVLGYYLRHTKRKIFNNVNYSIIFIIISALLLLLVSHMLSTSSGYYIFNRYNILIVIEVIGIFNLLKNLNLDLDSSSIFYKTTFSIAKYSYGIYLIHQFVIFIVMVILNEFISIGPVYYMLILFVCTLCGSWGLLAMLNRIPYVNRVIGAK